MDFRELLGLAAENKAKSQSKMKAAAKERKLSENVQKFLRQKNEKERKKKVEEEEKRRNLLELRADNKKSKRAMNSMLKMTKSADKGLFPSPSSSATGTNLEAECDEEDFGYESSAASNIFNRLMAKYEKQPQVKMFPDSNFSPKKDHNKTLQRVKNRLENGDDPPVKATADSGKRDVDLIAGKSKKETREEELRRKRLEGAQKAKPQSFQELMKMAKKKQNEPSNKGQQSKKGSKECEFNRPMTKKQKEEFIRERNSYLRKIGKLPPSSSSSSSSSSTAGPSTSSSSGLPTGNNKSKSEVKPKKPAAAAEQRPPPEEPKKKPKPAFRGPEFHPAVVKQQQQQHKKSQSGISHNNNKRVRSPSPVAKRGSKRQRVIESDEEEEDDYDSEMDDFIDDSDARVDISAEIRGIFGYDKRKYKDEDFDDRSMENNSFASVMKEEVRSAKIGMQEDLEDMRREEEEKKRKMKKRKR